MDPVSSTNRSTPDTPTPAELEAAACLPREPEPPRLQSRLTDPPLPAAPVVTALVEKHAPPRTAVPPPPNDTPSAGKHSPHPGIALSVAANVAAGPGIAVGGEASLGVVIDLSEPRISLFSSSGWGTALAPALSAGVSEQASLVEDVARFWGSDAEHGLNLPAGGVSINYTTPVPGGPREFNGVTGSVGPSVGGDGHSFEGTTTEHVSVSLRDIQDALKQVLGLPGLHRVGP